MHICNRCTRSFASKRDLNHHINNRQKPCSKPSHYCKACNKAFSSARSLSQHKERCRGVGEDVLNERRSDALDSEEEEESEKYVKLDPEESSIGNESSSSDDIIALDAWKIIMHRADDGKMTRLLDSFKYFVQVCEGFVRDIAYRKVIQTARKIKEENNDMDFDDVLDCAMDKRKSLIFTTAIEAMSKTASKDNEEQ